MSKKTIFNLEWTDRNLNPQWADWIQPVEIDPYKARCRFCAKTFNLSNMGRQAITSHTKSSKHRSIIDSKQSSIFNFCVPSSSTSQNQPNGTEAGDKAISAAEIESKNEQPLVSSTLDRYVTKEKTLTAEILWAMKLVMSHSSYNSFKDAGQLFLAMFPDSDIAKNITLGSTKMAYLIAFGLAPYFHSSIIKEISSTYFSLCIDEALNAVSQKKQMDIIIRYWPDNSDQVKVRYFNSVFLGHSTANDLYEKFCEGAAELKLESLLQVSLDGPNVNKKFWRHLCDELKANKGFSLINIGTCSLHVIHGAFQTGNKATPWNLNLLFQSLYRLFKNSPARRSDFIAATSSNKFPLKFCQIRWVENVAVAERAIEVLPEVKKYLKAARKELPSNISVTTIDDALNDKLIFAKISFFMSIAAILEPFLKSFQSPSPMVPYLYGSLADILRLIMSRFVKVEILREASTPLKLIQINVTSTKVHCRNEEVDVGIAARSYMRKSSASESEKGRFLSESKHFLIKMTEKIIDRSPVDLSIIRAMSCLDPSALSANPVLCEKRMNVLLQLLHDRNILSHLNADRAKQQFSTFTYKVTSEWKDAFATFSPKNARLDEFFSTYLNKKDEFKELWLVVKIVLTLSHGNASVESGFSINKDMLVENLHESSLVALRTTYDAVKSYGGPVSVKMTPELLQSAKMSRTRYHLALEEKKKIGEKEKKTEAEKKRTLDQIKVLQQKRAKLATDVEIQNKKLEEEIIELQKKV